MKTIHLFDNAKEAIPAPAHTTIFKQNDIAELMYVLVEGELAIVRDGQELATLSAGSMVGEMAILENRPHYASAVTKTACRLVPISRQRFQFLVEQTPHFALDMMEIMASRLHQMDERVTQRVHPTSTTHS